MMKLKKKKKSTPTCIDDYPKHSLEDCPNISSKHQRNRILQELMIWSEQDTYK